MRIRSISIDIVEWEGRYACDVNVTFTDNETMIIPTKLYSTDHGAYNRAREIQSSLFLMSEQDLDTMFEKYLAKKIVSPFKDILDKMHKTNTYDIGMGVSDDYE